MTTEHIDSGRHPIDDAAFADRCRRQLDTEGVLVLPGFLHDALHRVTPTTGSVTRMLVVFAFNTEPGVTLSDSALTTFYGRTA